MKKIISLFTMLSIALSVLCGLTASAEFTKGQVIFIDTLEELEQFRDNVNSGVDYSEVYVHLGDDIDMSEKYGEGKEAWTPIGDADHPFIGSFDGGGHTINLAVYHNYENILGFGGLFGFTETASTIERLNVSGTVTVLGTIFMKPTYSNDRYVGAVAGYNKGTIKNCANKANVRYTGNVGHSGGIAGETEGKIINCYNLGQADNNIAYTKDTSLIQNCYYLSPNEDIDQYGAYGKKSEQFASGEVTYLLNGEKSDGNIFWYQDIGDDAFPLLDSSHAVVRDDGYNYYNSNITSDNKIKTYTACVSEKNMKNAYKKIFSYEELLNSIPQPLDTNDITEKYSEEFFKNKFLIIKYFDWGGSSQRYEITSVRENAENISVDIMDVSSPLTSDDVTYWLLFAEVDRSLSDKELKINFIPYKEKSYPYKITGLRFTDGGGNEITAPEQGKSFVVEADIVKTEERNEKDCFFVAVYDKNDALISLDYVKANFAVDGDCSFGFNIPAQETTVGSVKAFVWHTFGSAEPLAEAKTLSASK